MTIQYDFYQSPHTIGTTRKRYHARVVRARNVNGKDFVREVVRRTAFSVAEVTATLIAVNETLTDLLSQGHNVKVPGIGSFQISLSCPETRRPGDTRAGSIKVKTVHLRPEKALVSAVSNRATFVRARWKVHSNERLSLTDLARIVKEHLASHPYLRRADLEQLAGLTRTTAVNRLREMVAQGYIENVSSDRHHPLYVWKKSRG